MVWALAALAFSPALSAVAASPHYFDGLAGPVAAHRHPNGGGWVADTAKVDPSARIGPGAVVYEFAVVDANAQIDGAVSGHAHVGANSIVSEGAKVFNRSFIGEGVIVRDSARVFGFARITCSTLEGSARVHDHAVVSCNPKGRSRIEDHAEIHDHARVLGSRIGGNGRIGGNATVASSWVREAGRVDDDALVDQDTVVEGNGQVAGHAKVHRSSVHGTAVVEGDAELTCKDANHGDIQSGGGLELPGKFDCSPSLR